MARASEAITPASVEDYLNLPYHVTLVRDRWDDGVEGWFAEVQELRGCMTQGETPDEAMTRLRDAMAAWIEAGLDEGHAIPLPREERDYSGRFLLRIPRGLHAALARLAEEDGVSLNLYVATRLAEVVGYRSKSTA
jgi:antitoxin HicB